MVSDAGPGENGKHFGGVVFGSKYLVCPQLDSEHRAHPSIHDLTIASGSSGPAVLRTLVVHLSLDLDSFHDKFLSGSNSAFLGEKIRSQY